MKKASFTETCSVLKDASVPFFAEFHNSGWTIHVEHQLNNDQLRTLLDLGAIHTPTRVLMIVGNDG